MNARTIRTGKLDHVAMTLSGLCLVHCVATALLLGTISSLAGALGNPLIHEVGLALAILLGVVSLGVGIAHHRRILPLSVAAFGVGAMTVALMVPHGTLELFATMLGVALLATGHLLNRLALA